MKKVRIRKVTGAAQPPQHEAGAAFHGVSMRFPEPGGCLPPLPDSVLDDASEDQFPPQLPPHPLPIPTPIPTPFPLVRKLRQGCYYIRYIPKAGPSPFPKTWYEGTMRVEKPTASSTTASGDLYLHPAIPAVPAGHAVDPSGGIPIFPRNRYRYYLRVTRVLEGVTLSKQFTLGFNMHRFTAATNSWSDEGAFTALMQWKTGPSGYPSDYLEGDLKNGSGATVGTLSMGWVSKYLRRATVEIDRVSVSELPLDNGAGIGWKDVFDKVLWQLNVVPSNSDVAQPSGESWSDAEMHSAMLARRDSADLDREWRYHILCVRKIDSTPRGIMYDNGATDSNNVPREGIGISSHWVIPKTPDWGKVQGLRFGAAAAPYFRTALHEIGHAMGLYHNTVDMGVMNTTDVISAAAVPPVKFPDNIKWAHAADDQKRLRHLPDIWVRPGGIPFGLSYGSSPISPDDEIADADGLVVEVETLVDSFPIGAPVRADFRLVNRSSEPLLAPASLSMRAGAVKGRVVDPSGTVRTFKPLLLCVEEANLTTLEPGQSVANALTLLRGPQGALFPTSGYYRLIVEVEWDENGQKYAVSGETSVMVTGAQNEKHAAAANTILSTPDALLTLVLGGDHLAAGVAAIQAGVKDPVLHPHYAAIEARRVGNRFGARKADYQRVDELMGEATVMSANELRRVSELVSNAEAPARKKIGKKLKAKGESIDAPASIQKQVDEL